MKKYCLTSCAKEKISDAKKWCISVISAVLFAVALTLGFGVVSCILGFIIEGFYVLINGNLIGLHGNMFEIGAVVLLVGSISLMLLTLIILMLIDFYKGIKRVVRNRISPESNWREECKIFEECKEEE